MDIFEQFCQSNEGKTMIYVAENFLDEVKEMLGEDRTYHKQFKFKLNEWVYTLELRAFDRIFFHIMKNNKNISLILFNRDSKEFKETKRHLIVGEHAQDCRDFIYFQNIFRKIRSVDSRIHKVNTTMIDLELDQHYLSNIQTFSDEKNDPVEWKKILEKVRYSSLSKELKKEVNQQLHPILTFIKENKKMDLERSHNINRLLQEDLPNLIDSFVLLQENVQNEQREAFVETVKNITSVIQEEVNSVTLAHFQKQLMLFEKRYKK